MLVRLGFGRKGFWHKSKLCQWLHATLNVGIENTIHNLPVVYGVPVGIFPVHVGRTPFEGSGSVTRAHQVVRPNVNRNRAQRGQFGQELLAILHVGVVGFIVTEPGPDVSVVRDF